MAFNFRNLVFIQLIYNLHVLFLRLRQFFCTNVQLDGHMMFLICTGRSAGLFGTNDNEAGNDSPLPDGSQAENQERFWLSWVAAGVSTPQNLLK